MNLGGAIRVCRTGLGMDLAELAAAAGMSVSYVSLLERGKRDAPFRTICRICNALTIPPVLLVFLASNQNELGYIDPELSQKLAFLTLQSMIKSRKTPLVTPA